MAKSRCQASTTNNTDKNLNDGDGGTSEKIQFQTNIPVEIALKYSGGKEVTGQYGDQVLYTLTDGRVMYVSPIVKKKIDEAGIGRGELFTITKAERKNGTRRTIEWVINGNGDVGHTSADHTNSENGGPKRTTNNGAFGTGTQKNGDNGRAIPPRDPNGFLATGQGQSLLQAFLAAIDLAASTEKYASSCGMQFQFTGADVREIGLSIYRAGK
jgi:hypothetical protein